MLGRVAGCARGLGLCMDEVPHVGYPGSDTQGAMVRYLDEKSLGMDKALQYLCPMTGRYIIPDVIFRYRTYLASIFSQKNKKPWKHLTTPPSPPLYHASDIR